MDGNRRWARAHALDAWKGHEAGARRLEELFRWAIDLGISELTLYALSIQNLSRDKREVDFLLDLLRKEFEKLLVDERVAHERVRIRVAGRTRLLPADIQELISAVERKTMDNDRLIVNFAICYGGREEIVDAVEKLVEDGVAVSEDSIRERLRIRNDPDLIIRTGGDTRTSNFLTWQSAYSEWAFLDALWPEFTKEDFKGAIDDFSSRERRFGK